eukprot:s332_g40.t1
MLQRTSRAINGTSSCCKWRQCQQSERGIVVQQQLDCCRITILHREGEGCVTLRVLEVYVCSIVQQLFHPRDVQVRR